MKALYKGKQVDVWEISRTGMQPDWVQLAFRKGYLEWSDNRLRIQMSGLSPSAANTLEIGLAGSVGYGLAGYGIWQMGDLGDFLDVTNRTLVSPRKFAKRYERLEG